MGGCTLTKALTASHRVKDTATIGFNQSSKALRGNVSSNKHSFNATSQVRQNPHGWSQNVQSLVSVKPYSTS